MREPFNFTHEQIAKLTPYQLRHHVFRPRDEDGRLVRGSKRAGRGCKPYRVIFYNVWAKRGKTKAEIGALWAEYQAKNSRRSRRKKP